MRVREAGPEDRAAVRAFLRRLSVQTVQARYLTAARGLDASLSEREANRLLVRDPVDHVVLLADDGDEIRGIGEYAVHASPTCAEVGIMVEDAFRGHGLGRVLYERLERIACSRGITSFIGTVHDQNRRVHTIVVKNRRWVEVQPEYGGIHFSVAVDPRCA